MLHKPSPETKESYTSVDFMFNRCTVQDQDEQPQVFLSVVAKDKKVRHYMTELSRMETNS
jgi:hypothetical protein